MPSDRKSRKIEKVMDILYDDELMMMIMKMIDDDDDDDEKEKKSQHFKKSRGLVHSRYRRKMTMADGNDG